MATKIKKIHTLVISDLHLGSGVSQAEKVEKFLKSMNFHKLVLLGDIFDSLDFRDLSPEDWSLLRHIGKLSKSHKIRWVEGNHDKGLSEIFGAMLGAKVYEEYHWQYKGKKYLAIHGHQFDRFLVDNAVISYIASMIYLWIQKIDFRDKRISRFIKETSKGWLRLSQKVATEAIKHGKKHKADYVLCGHTHKVMKKISKKPKYFNAGCWTDLPCTYISIDEGEIKICEY